MSNTIPIHKDTNHINQNIHDGRIVRAYDRKSSWMTC